MERSKLQISLKIAGVGTAKRRNIRCKMVPSIQITFKENLWKTSYVSICSTSSFHFPFSLRSTHQFLCTCECVVHNFFIVNKNFLRILSYFLTYILKLLIPPLTLIFKNRYTIQIYKYIYIYIYIYIGIIYPTLKSFKLFYSKSQEDSFAFLSV